MGLFLVSPSNGHDKYYSATRGHFPVHSSSDNRSPESYRRGLPAPKNHPERRCRGKEDNVHAEPHDNHLRFGCWQSSPVDSESDRCLLAMVAKWGTDAVADHV